MSATGLVIAGIPIISAAGQREVTGRSCATTARVRGSGIMGTQGIYYNRVYK